jgi:hypothetical protein
MIISEPVHTAVWDLLPVGTPVLVGVSVQLSVTGSYRPPALQ